MAADGHGEQGAAGRIQGRLLKGRRQVGARLKALDQGFGRLLEMRQE